MDAIVDTIQEPKSVWDTLSSQDCSDKIEKKGNLSYLSWAWAWGLVKSHYPDASFEKHWHGEPDTRLPYATDAQGYAFVLVTVNVGDQTATETYPVLGNGNKAVQAPNAFQVNTALQRCLTKALGYLGLGHYIYAGEDLPVQASVEMSVNGVPYDENGVEVFVEKTSKDNSWVGPLAKTALIELRREIARDIQDCQDLDSVINLRKAKETSKVIEQLKADLPHHYDHEPDASHELNDWLGLYQAFKAREAELTKENGNGV